MFKKIEINQKGVEHWNKPHQTRMVDKKKVFQPCSSCTRVLVEKRGCNGKDD